MLNSLSPIPQKSVLLGEDKLISLDWLRWLRDVTGLLLRILNRYDQSKSGTTTLVLGTVVIANTNVSATSSIRTSYQNIIGTPGFLSVALNPGVGFTLNSTSALDNSTVFYEIVEGL